MRLKVIVFLFAVSAAVHASVFEIQTLTEEAKSEMKRLKTWQSTCPVSLERLRAVKFSYYDFEGQEKNDGEIVVLDAVAKRTLKIFKILHANKFPISKARPVEYYQGNDEASMEDNNSSCYNCREITGGGLSSIHSYGLALDLNPIQNPYISLKGAEGCSAKILPLQGKDYINRRNERPGMVEKIVKIFKANGFTTWGGEWNDRIDWQHFQPPRSLAQLLAVMSPEHSEVFFDVYASTSSKIFDSIEPTDNRLIDLYKRSTVEFMMNIIKNNRTQFFNADNGAEAILFLERKLSNTNNA